jgi:hypothetical protein
LLGQHLESIAAVAAGRLAEAGERLVHHRRVEQRLAPRDRLERLDQVVRADLLEDVAGRAGGDGVHEQIVVGVGGQDDDPRVGQGGDDVAGGLDAAPAGQAYVHHDHVRLLDARLRQRLVGGPGLGHHLEARVPANQRLEPESHDLVVVHQHDPQIAHASPPLPHRSWPDGTPSLATRRAAADWA